MKRSDFWFDLPEKQIAQTPVEPRDHSRLLLMNRTSGACSHHHFYDIVDLLQPGDLLVVNDSRVIPARLYGVKEDTGAHIEVLLLSRRKRTSGKHWSSLEKRQSRGSNLPSATDCCTARCWKRWRAATA